MRECCKCYSEGWCNCTYLERTGKTVDDRKYTKEGWLIVEPFKVDPEVKAKIAKWKKEMGYEDTISKS